MKIRIIIILMCSQASTGAQPSIVALGGRDQGSSAFAVSDDGIYVVGESFTHASSFPFIWTRENGVVEIPLPSTGSNYTAYNVSHDGKYVAGGFSLDGGLGGQGYIWSEETGVMPLGSLPGGTEFSGAGFFGGQTEFAIGASSVGFTNTGVSLNRATKWTVSRGLEALPLPTVDDENFQSGARDVLSDGRIFGTSQSGSWLWSESTGFEYLPGAEGMSHISPDASFMSGTLLNTDTLADGAAYWTPDTGAVFLPLSVPGSLSRVTGSSDDGSIIIGSQSVLQVVWIDQGAPISIVDYAESYGIDMDGWSIFNVWDISDDGMTIVGSGRFEGQNQGFVLTIPAPGGGVLLGVGLLATRRRR